jgi:glutamate synthase domain-containing protein 3
MNDVVIKAGDRPIRAVHEEIQAAANAGASIRVTDTRARHNLGVGLPQGCRIRFEGPVGYYCGGLNSGARIEIAGNAGWAAGEAQSHGHVTIDGYAGMSVGSTMLGGTIHVRGDCGPRCGVAMKGGNIIVEGKLGYQSGFMSHGGKIIALGGAGESCGDALWQGEVWIAGDIGSLGVDAQIREPDADEVAAVDAILEPLGLKDTSRNWRKIVAGQRLWYFESRDAKAWLMI